MPRPSALGLGEGVGELSTLNSKLKTQNIEDRIRIAIARVVGKVTDRASEKWVCPVRSHVGGRFEGESTLVHPGVGKSERRPAAHH